MDKMQETLSKAIPWLAEYLRHLRAKNDPKALSLTNDLAEAQATLSSPHPEAREDGYEIGTPREFAERLAWMTTNGKPDLDQWENHIKFRDAALRSQLARKDEGLREALERVVPYVVATLTKSNSVVIEGKPDWRGVHAGRADSSIRQLEGLLAALREPDGRKGE